MNLKVLALCSAAACAFAATSTYAATATASSGATDVSEVVVTAQKRTEKLERVPIAISAYTAKVRDTIGINSLQDYAAFTPGLSYSSATDRVFLRGVGRETNTIGSDPGVATYSDGVYNASTSSVASDTLFAQRTEILRGPQGTLYGRNSIGGAIDVISQRPTDTLQGEVRTTFGNFGVYNVEGAVSGPITDKVKFRLAGLRDDQEEGYYKNLAGGTSEGGKGISYYVEGQLQADITPDFDAWLKIFDADSRSNPRSAYGGGTNYVGPFDYSPFPSGFLTPGAAFGYTQPGFVASGPAINPGQTNYRDFDTNTPGKAHLADNYGATLHLDWHVAGVDVKYIGGVQHYRFTSTVDLDNSSVSSYQFPLNPVFSICAVYIPGCTPLSVHPSDRFNYLEDKTFWSNELDFSSSRPGPVQWIAGLYEYGENFTQADEFNDSAQPQLLAPANGPANPSGDYVNAGGNLNTTTYAAFGQVDWAITSTLKLTGGVRYTWDHKQGVEHLRELCFGLPACGYAPDQYGSSTPSLDITSSVLPPNFSGRGVAGPTTIDPTTGIAYRPLSASWSAATGTAGLDWTPDQSTLVYAKYSRGYKSGGFNEGGISPEPETDPEYIDAFEIGAKKDFGRQLQLNAAAYYYNYNGFQVPLTVNTAGGAQMTNFVNLRQVVSYGAELEAIWQPTSQLQFLLSYSYLNATIKQAQTYVDVADPSAGNQSVVGQTVPESPRNKIALNGSYRFDFRPGSLTVSASYMWKEATFDSIFNRAYYQAPSYSQVDLRALWSDASDRYTIIVYAKNVFDTKGYDNAFGTLITNTSTVAQSYSYTPPRTFGIELRYKFH
jgi:iron complex outermembrane receptor protein